MLDHNKIRKKIESKFSGIDYENEKINGLTINSQGHEGGVKVENWVEKKLEEIEWNASVFSSEDFIENYLESIGRDEKRVSEELCDKWWGLKVLVTKKQIDEFLANKKVSKWQQAFADIVIFYGGDMTVNPNKLFLINVKSHNVEKKGRHPNIVSSLRVMRLFRDILIREDANQSIKELNLFFIGVDFSPKLEYADVKKTYIKDFFKLDVGKIPQINFDAAIQMQWHVDEMVEIEQNKYDMIKNFSSLVYEKWKEQAKRRTLQFKKLHDTIEIGIEEKRDQIE